MIFLSIRLHPRQGFASPDQINQKIGVVVSHENFLTSPPTQTPPPLNAILIVAMFGNQCPIVLAINTFIMSEFIFFVALMGGNGILLVFLK